MADPDLMTSVLTHGGAVAGGGGVAAWVVRALFSGIAQRLDKIEEAIERNGEKSDQRHDALIEKMSKVDQRSEAAFRVADELRRRVEALENRRRR